MTRGKRRAAGMLLAALACAGTGLAGCGRYGAPLRAQEYRDAEKKEAEAAAQRRQRTSPQERNEPLPEAP